MQIPDLDKRFKKLFQSGKLVQVHVSKWAMTVSATEHDLGLDKLKDNQHVPEFITLGKKALFTDDVRLVFSRLESQARAYLLNNSHSFPIADAHFVPQKALIKVLAGLEEMRVAYMEEVELFLTEYEQYKEKMFKVYPEYKDNLLPYYPPIQDVRPKFGFTVSVYEVAFPKRMEKVTANDLIAQNLAMEAAQVKYEGLMKEQYQLQLDQMQKFIKDSALAMREEIIKTFETIANKIQSKEVVTETNLKTLRNVIEGFDALDFLDDDKVKQNLKAVKALVSKGANFKDDAAALARLSVAVNTTLETARAITDIDELTGEYTRRLDLEL